METSSQADRGKTTEDTNPKCRNEKGGIDTDPTDITRIVGRPRGQLWPPGSRQHGLVLARGGGGCSWGAQDSMALCTPAGVSQAAPGFCLRPLSPAQGCPSVSRWSWLLAGVVYDSRKTEPTLQVLGAPLGVGLGALPHHGQLPVCPWVVMLSAGGARGPHLARTTWWPPQTFPPRGQGCGCTGPVVPTMTTVHTAAAIGALGGTLTAHRSWSMHAHRGPHSKVTGREGGSVDLRL